MMMMMMMLTVIPTLNPLTSSDFRNTSLLCVFSSLGDSFKSLEYLKENLGLSDAT